MEERQLSGEEYGTDESLTQRAAKSGIWVFSLRIVQELARVAKLIILARLLSPEDFGLMGIALLILAAVETFSQPGFDQALIQKKGDVTGYLNGAWTLLVLRGVILCGVMLLAAPYMARFFKAPEASGIIQATAASVLIHGFYNIGIIYFKKGLQFNKHFFFELSGTVAELVVTVAVVLIWRNVWALVFGLIASNLAKCAASYILHPYRPRFSFDRQKMTELWRFGRWVLGSTILIFLVTEGDDIIVGRLLGATALGFYQLAYRISNMPATEITHVISQVMFPAYSSIQDDRRRLGDAFIRVLRLVAFIAFPVSTFIFIFAHDFTALFLGEKWLPMVPAMRILVIAGLVRAIMATPGPIIYAVGKPRIDTACQIIRFIVLGVLIYPLTAAWGLSGASLTVAISTFISAFGFCYAAVSITSCGLWRFVKVLAIPTVNVALIAAAYYSLRLVLSGGLGAFIALFLACTVTYAMATAVSVWVFGYEIRDSVKNIARSLRRRKPDAV